MYLSEITADPCAALSPVDGRLCSGCVQDTVSVTCYSCGMQPKHLETLTLPKPQDLLELDVLDGIIAKILDAKSFGEFSGALGRENSPAVATLNKKCLRWNKLYIIS